MSVTFVQQVKLIRHYETASDDCFSARRGRGLARPRSLVLCILPYGSSLQRRPLPTMKTQQDQA